MSPDVLSGMNGNNETKSEIRARLEELQHIVKLIDASIGRQLSAGHQEDPELDWIRNQTYERIRSYKDKLDTAQEA